MSDGTLRTFVVYDPRFNLTWSGTEQVVEYAGDVKEDSVRTTGLEATAYLDQSPKDMGSAVARIGGVAALNTARASYFRQIEERITIDDLPLVLTSLVTAFNKSENDSTSDFPAANQAFSFVGNGSGNINPRANASSSASVQPVIAPTFKRYPRRFTTLRCEFFLHGDITETQIKNKISANLSGTPTINSWPVIVEKSETLALQGQSVGANASAETQVGGFVTSPSTQGYYYFYGEGSGTEGSVNNSFYQLPPCIHAAITISPDTDTADATAEANADSCEVTVNSTTVSTIANGTGTITKTANASITPNSLGATSPTALPTSGRYLYDWKVDLNVGYGDALVTAWIIDASVFA